LGLISFLIVCGVAGLLSAAPSDGDWEEVWVLAQTSYSAQSGADALELLISEKELGTEHQVASFLCASLRGEAGQFVCCDALPALSPRGSWAFSLALEPGDVLNLALVSSLQNCPDGLVEPVLARGFREFMAATDSARAEVAVNLGEALHERAGAVWSAQNLAIAYTRQGSYSEGSECLLAALEVAMSDADRRMLESRLCLIYWGEGGHLAARACLGASLCQGNSDSGIVLGLSSLERGRFDRAKTLFRSVLGHDPSQAWARKGWGLSMVPH